MSKAMQLKAKIRNLAQSYHVPAQAILQNYILERFIERISLSSYKNSFIIKGGILIESIVGINNRTTMDLDTTVRGHPLSEAFIKEAILEICSIKLEDGIDFVINHVDPIREDDEYRGFRVSLIGTFESIRTPIKIDITTGDIITPHAVRYTFQSLFTDKEIDVWAYNIETILAEKIETILQRSVFNTRLRDYYDVYIITKTQQDNFDKAIVTKAIITTAKKRGSQSVLQDKEKILLDIQSDPTMKRRWELYCNEFDYANGISFDNVIDAIKTLTDELT